MDTFTLVFKRNLKQIVTRIFGLWGKAFLFFIAIVSFGLIVLFTQVREVQDINISVYLFWVSMAVLSELRPITFFSSLITVSAAIHIAAIILFGTPVAMLVGSLGAGFADLMGRRGLNRMIFNACQYAITIYLAGWTFYFFKGSDEVLAFPQDLFAFILGCIAYVVVNETIVCTMVALSIGTRLRTVFRKGVQLEAMHFPTIVPLAFLIAYLYQQEPLTIIFLIIPLVMAHVHFKNYVELISQAQDTLEVLADAIDQRDSYTASHSRRVAKYAEAIAYNMKLKNGEVEQIKMAGRVHDIGKISFSDLIIQKKGSLSKPEFDAIKNHSIIGYKMLCNLKIYKNCSQYVLYHHERYDGKGYPSGLRGDAIPLGARILAVADTFDAITTDRPYRKAQPRDKALEEISRCSGTQFDPEVVEAFLRVDLRCLDEDGK